MTARRPLPPRAKAIAASTFGSMEPAANSPAAMCACASSTVMCESSLSSALPKPMQTCSTAVRMSRQSAPTISASFAEAKSLSMTASTPVSAPFVPRVTGMPPPPQAMTTNSRSSSARIA